MGSEMFYNVINKQESLSLYFDLYQKNYFDLDVLFQTLSFKTFNDHI